MKYGRNINVKEHIAFRKEEKEGGALNIKNALICLEIQL